MLGRKQGNRDLGEVDHFPHAPLDLVTPEERRVGARRELILTERLEHLFSLLARGAPLFFHCIALTRELAPQRGPNLIALLIGETQIRGPALGVLHARVAMMAAMKLRLDGVDELAALILVEDVVEATERSPIGAARWLDRGQQRVD